MSGRDMSSACGRSMFVRKNSAESAGHETIRGNMDFRVKGEWLTPLRLRLTMFDFQSRS